MPTDTKSIAITYYKALGDKNLDKIKECLHPNIQFTDPKESIHGKEAVLKAAEGFSKIFKTLTIRTHFGSEDQAMVVYEVEIPGLSQKLQAASLLSFQDSLIAKIELFYDSKSLFN